MWYYFADLCANIYHSPDVATSDEPPVDAADKNASEMIDCAVSLYTANTQVFADRLLHRFETTV